MLVDHVGCWTLLLLLTPLCCQLALLLLAVDNLRLFLGGVVCLVKQRGQGGWQGSHGVSLNITGVRGREVRRVSYL